MVMEMIMEVKGRKGCDEKCMKWRVELMFALMDVCVCDSVLSLVKEMVRTENSEDSDGDDNGGEGRRKTGWDVDHMKWN